MNAIIHYARYNRPEVRYEETFVADDGVRLDTRTDLDPAFAVEWSRNAWQANGFLEEGQVIATVCKHHFYREWFDVIELLDASGTLLGYYCDVITPLRRVDGEYYLQDLLLDLWIFPDGRYLELDWDEFRSAVAHDLLPPQYHHQAVEVMRRMISELHRGIFPSAYLPQSSKPPAQADQ